jgi:hypothetical protein
MDDLVTTYQRVRLRSVAIAVATVIAGAALLAPAVGQAAAFLTKQKARKLFLENTTVTSAPATVTNGQGAAIQVSCPPGLQATHGGVDSPHLSTNGSGFGNNLLTNESRPILSGARSVGWYVEVANTTSSPLTASAYAVCSK